MLHIQQFLRSGKTLSDVYQKYDIDFNISDELGVVVFNYRMLSPLTDPLVRETRGLVLELETWNVVSKSIDAFFEPNNPLVKETMDAFDWGSANAVEKLDGALITLYYYKDAWRICTRFSPDGQWLVWSMNSSPSTVNWLEYTHLALRDMGTDWDEFTSKLDKNIFYTFEICGPENRVIVIYKERFISLVAAVSRDTLQELDIYSMDFPELKPKRYPVRNLAECWDLIDQNKEPYDSEGFIAIDKNFRRLKIRSPYHAAIAQTYSIEDESAALRELRKLDLGGSYTTSSPSGSCHVMSTVIRTLKDRVTIAACNVGDLIAGRNNTPQEITHILEGMEEMFEVKHEAGSTFCSASHPLFLADGKHCIAAINLRKGDKLYLYGGMASRLVSVKNTGRIERVRFLSVIPDREYIADDLLMHNFPASSASSTAKSGVTGASLSIFFARVLALSRWTSDQYQSMKNGEVMAESIGAEEIWPQAVQKLKEGMNMSQILDSSPEPEIIAALRKYEETVISTPKEDSKEEAK